MEFVPQQLFFGIKKDFLNFLRGDAMLLKIFSFIALIPDKGRRVRQSNHGSIVYTKLHTIKPFLKPTICGLSRGGPTIAVSSGSRRTQRGSTPTHSPARISAAAS